MVNLQPYRDVLKKLGFKESDQRNLWVIESVDLKTGENVKAGIHLGFYDPEKKVGEPRIYLSNGEEIIERDCFERCGNLSDFYYEREILLEKEETEDEGDTITIKEAFGEQRSQTLFNPQPTEMPTPKPTPSPTQTDVSQDQMFSALKRRIDEIKGKKEEPKPRLPEKVEIQSPPIILPQFDKQRLLEMKKDEMTKISYQMHDLSMRIEEVKKEIDERRKEDEARLGSFEYDLEKLVFKQKLINETYEKIIKELG